MDTLKKHNWLIDHIETLLLQTTNAQDIRFDIQINKNKEYGEFASNIAMKLAKILKKNPMEIAQDIAEKLPSSPWIQKTKCAAPGFINFYLSTHAYQNILQNSLQPNQPNVGKRKKILLEFVSANPTGPLHVGHARGAVYGDVLCNVLTHLGFLVEKEYYLNDVGRQMNILAISVWLRRIQKNNPKIPFPENAYQAHYIIEISKTLPELPVVKWETIEQQITQLDNDPDKQINQWIAFAKNILNDHFTVIQKHALVSLTQNIKTSLEAINIRFDRFFSEGEMLSNFSIMRLLELLKKTNSVYENDGAWWLRTTPTDEKDRVLIRKNGQPTYFTSDIIYHHLKYQRGYDQIINIWGSDHHGYIPRVQSAMQHLKHPLESLEIKLIQFVSLKKDNKNISMSTRSGEFITLTDLQSMITEEAMRFFYVRSNIDQTMVLDIDLANAQQNENPIFYIQYACARIHKLLENKNPIPNDQKNTPFEIAEKNLLLTLSQWEQTKVEAGLKKELFKIPNYLEDLASCFHRFYQECPILKQMDSITNKRLLLCKAAQTVLSDGLRLLGITACKRM